MPSIQKTVDKIISETDYATLGHGASTTLVNCERVDLTNATQFTLSIDCDTVPTDVTVTLQLYPSHDGENYDDEPWNPNTDWASGWTSTAAKAQETSKEIPPLPKYMKVIATNNHGSSDITNFRLYATVQKMG